jgi:HK97 family phage major capsid protein
MALQTSGITLPREVVTETINKAQGVSTIAQLSPSTPQLFVDSTHLVFNPSSEAEVVAEGAKKGSYEQSLSPVEGKRVKLVTTTRVSNELQWADEDAKTEIISNIIDDQAKALGRAIDYVIYHAIDPKSGSALSGYTSLISGATAVTGSTKEYENIDLMADALLDYEINGLALSREFASALRKVRVEATGQRLFPEIPLSLEPTVVDGISAVTSNTVNGALAKTATGVRAIMGDFSTIKWGMVRDMNSEIIEYGDPDGAGTDLKNTNEVAYRTESMFAYAVLDPKAFAYLKKASA